MTHPLDGKRIVLGVTGSIAAYKAADLASKLTQTGALVDVILTPGAERFITPLTFQSVTGRKAYVDADLWGGDGHVTHIALGRAAQLIIIAPASANTLARLAHGLADNLLTVTALAAHCPLLIAPAMDAGMFDHPATRANVDVLTARGVRWVGPEEGRMASGLLGRGRMSEPPDILGQARWLMAQGGTLTGRKVVVTAGGTQEAIDPVRFITNRSSGRQGFALAQAALDAGADVTLIAGATQLATPVGARRIDAHSAAEMLRATLDATQDADALIMAAAVADFRPAQAAGEKLKKSAGLGTLALEATADILAAVAARRVETGYPRCVVGFAAETQALIDNARAKLHAKGLDLIVANDVSAPDAGFEVSTNRVTLLFADGRREDLPLQSKQAVAERIVQEIIFGGAGND